MSKWFDIFKEGIHFDTAGRRHVITADDLQKIERKFSEAKDDVALVVGHPKTNSPAFGWLKRVKVFGDKLRGSAEDIVPEFAEAVRKRIYKKISVSLRPDLSIRHVGFLGAVPPAVKGLESVMFAEEDDSFTIEFSDEDLNFSDAGFVYGKFKTIGRALQNLRDLVVEKFGIEAADKVVAQWDLDFLKEDPPDETKKEESAIQSFNEPITPERGKEDKSMKEKDKPETSGAEKTEDFAEKVTSLETENTKLLTENKALKKKQVEGTVANFMEKLGGKLLPKFKKGITELLINLEEAGQEINFSETEKKPSATLLMEFLEAQPVQIPTKEVGGPAGGEGNEGPAEFADVNVDEDRLEIHNKAKALEKKEKIPYADAVRRVMKGGN